MPEGACSRGRSFRVVVYDDLNVACLLAAAAAAVLLCVC